MKTTKTVTYRTPLAILAIFLLGQTAVCQDEHTKKFENKYTATKNTQLVVNNKYGDVDIRDWDKNEINIEVTIILKDVTSQKADQIFKEVAIDFSKEEDMISVETVYNEEFFRLVNKDQFLQEKRFEVNYLVMLPAYIKVDVENKYGNVFVSKLTSASSILVKYGSLKVNQIIAENKDNMALIDLAYSKGTIENCEWMKIITKYSQMNVQKSKALIIISKYSKLNVEQGSSLICESKYDSYEIGTLANFVTEAQYSNFRFNEISKKIELDTKYTDVKVSKVPSGFSSITIENSYGSVKIAIEPSATYTLKGHAKYAKINYPENSKVNRFQENTELQVEGIVGNTTSASSSVTIETQYGGVTLY